MEKCFSALSFHNNKVFLTLDHYPLTLENLVPRVNDSWDSDPNETPDNIVTSAKSNWVMSTCTNFAGRYSRVDTFRRILLEDFTGGYFYWRILLLEDFTGG